MSQMDEAQRPSGTREVKPLSLAPEPCLGESTSRCAEGAARFPWSPRQVPGRKSQQRWFGSQPCGG